MDSVALFLLLVAAIFLIGVIGELIFERTGVPDVVWLLGVGILLGPVFHVVDRETLGDVAPYFGAITLVIVLFDGGSELRVGDASRAAPRATFLGLVSFVISSGAVALISMLAAAVGWLPDGWSWLHGVTLGAILGGSSSIVIMPAIRQLKLPSSLSNLVSLESALTDVLCVVVAVASIHIAVTGATELTATISTLLRAFGIGLGGGLAVGLLALLALKRLRQSVHAYPLLLGMLLITYVALDALGGSAALGILVVAVLVGNASELSDALGLVRSARLGQDVVYTHDQLTFFVKSFFFTFMGAMLGPPWGLVALGVGLGVLLVAARIPAVLIGMLGTGLGRTEKGLLTVLLPRGMAAGVLAILPAQQGMTASDDMPVVVFAAVLTTILLFTVGVSVFRRQLPSEPEETTAAEPSIEDAAEKDATPPAPSPADAEPAEPSESPAIAPEPPEEPPGEDETPLPKTGDTL